MGLKISLQKTITNFITFIHKRQSTLLHINICCTEVNHLKLTWKKKVTRIKLSYLVFIVSKPVQVGVKHKYTLLT